MRDERSAASAWETKQKNTSQMRGNWELGLRTRDLGVRDTAIAIAIAIEIDFML